MLCYIAGTGIISTLSNILSQAKINIFYLSTANTDFILVQEEKLEKAITSLRENFDILTEGEDTLLDVADEEKSTFDVTSLKQNLVTVSSADAVVFDPSKSAGLTLYLLPDVMYLCRYVVVLLLSTDHSEMKIFKCKIFDLLRRLITFS